MNAFFDESGKFKDHKVVSFCGVVSAPAQFQSFTVDWGRHLHENGLQMLTAKDALNARIRLSEKNPALGIDNRIAALLPFIASVRKHLEAVTGVAIDVAAFKALPSHYFQVLGDNPFFTGFLRAILELLRLVGEQDRITLICDDEEQMALPMYKLYRRVKLIDHQAREKLAAISFADDRFLFGLQAADLLASLLRRESGKRFHETDYEYRPLFDAITTPRKEGENIWSVGFAFCDEEKLKSVAEGLTKKD